MKFVRKTLPVVVTVGVAAATVALLLLNVRTGPGTQIYPETGHTIRAPFGETYHEFGGPDVLGYPLSEAYRDHSGTLVQYFENARLEQAPGGYVQLGNLGIELGLARPPVVPDDNSGIFFPETQHFLHRDLTDGYLRLGGEGWLGAAISPPRMENDLLVQDFERARLALSPDGQVRLGNLGTIALAAFPPGGQDVMAAPPHNQSGPALRATLSVAEPTLYRDGVQTVYLTVTRRDDDSPVEGAQALVTISSEGGTAQLEMPPTDAQGISRSTFQVVSVPPGKTVTVEAHVIWGVEVINVSTIYLQWW